LEPERGAREVGDVAQRNLHFWLQQRKVK